MTREKDINDIMAKYRLAGKIRFISFSLLFIFLVLMKFIGGYSYLNPAFIALIIAEAVINQPYSFIVKRVDINRFQYYQMTMDIIAITWALYYMGGIEAPLVSIAYYAVILWAGVVSTTQAVFFAVMAAAILFSSSVILEHIGMLPRISFYKHEMPAVQMYSLLLGNISFLFAFAYFSAHSSGVIRAIQRKRQEESLRDAHKLLAAGYLIGSTAHDILNNLGNINGYAQLLLEGAGTDREREKMLRDIDRLGKKSAGLLRRLAMFSDESSRSNEPISVNKAIEDVLELVNPLLKGSNTEIEKRFGKALPDISGNKYQLQEAFLVFVLNALDAVSGRAGRIAITSSHSVEGGEILITFADDGRGIKPQDIKDLGRPFFTTKGTKKSLGIGLATAYGIIYRLGGRVDVKSVLNGGTSFTIHLSVKNHKRHI